MILTQVSFLVLKHSHRPLFIPLPDVERVLKDRVHDSADAKGWLDYIGNNLFHCGKKKDGCFLTWTTNSRALRQVWCRLLPCKVFWNLFTLTMSLVSLNVLPAVSRLNSLQTETQQQHHQINSFIPSQNGLQSPLSSDITHFRWEASPDHWRSIRHRPPGTPEATWRLSCRPFLWLLYWAQTGQH